MAGFRCDNDQPHQWHNVDVEVERTCDGLTPCGTQLHEPHQFVRQESRWCEGICGCGDTHREALHGRGEHK